jgi:hypothetical protein
LECNFEAKVSLLCRQKQYYGVARVSKFKFAADYWFGAQWLSIAAAIFVSMPSVSAQPPDFEGWTNINSHISLDPQKRYEIYLEVQPRLGNDWQRLTTTQVRAALVYNFDESISVYAGYAWAPAFVDSQYHRDYREDHRLWQQIAYRRELFGMQWLHRLRQEQRMIARTNEVAHRARYMLKGSQPLSDTGDFGVTVSDEVMVNLNGVDNGPWAGYDRNRIFLGPYWIVGRTRYEVVYIGEHLKRFGSDERWVNALGLQVLMHF